MLLSPKIDSVYELNSSLIDVYVGDDGNLHKVKDGADTVLPFNNGKGTYGTFKFNASGNITINLNQKPKEVIAVYRSNNVTTYNHAEYYSEDNPTMNIGKLSVFDNGFSINQNNTSFKNSPGEYYWR